MEVAYIFLAILIFVMYGLTTWYSSIEGFEDGKTTTLYDKDIFDEEYASIYDSLWNSNERIKYEEVSIHDLTLVEQPVTSIRVLDMCCGTATHACYFKQLGVDYLGVDTSDAMIEKARERCPNAKFNKGDISQPQLFSQKSFSHCLLLGFSMYMFPNAKIISDNAYQWLKPGGYFVVHLVDPDRFDPLHDLSSPFAAFSLQKYNLERQTESVVFFDKFKYTGKLVKKRNEDDASYDEVFSYYDEANNGGAKYRENKLSLTMPSKERMIDIIKTSGFTHIENVDLVRAGKEYQYICYFQK
uniref:Methyltransferase domain-containing protein n=1 Tax=viral metagenome TaxID=1070528 RepID=A0A6C0AI52_9ZZZZ